MAIEHMLGATPVTLTRENLSRKVKRVALAVSALSLLGGAVAMALEPRFGLLAAALVLGWTQLVGL